MLNRKNDLIFSDDFGSSRPPSSRKIVRQEKVYLNGSPRRGIPYCLYRSTRLGQYGNATSIPICMYIQGTQGAGRYASCFFFAVPNWTISTTLFFIIKCRCHPMNRPMTYCRCTTVFWVMTEVCTTFFSEMFLHFGSLRPLPKTDLGRKMDTAATG